jgi:hypothetical protein
MKTAIVAYDTRTKTWLLSAMQDANGVYMDCVKAPKAAQVLLNEIGGNFHRISIEAYRALRKEAERGRK